MSSRVCMECQSHNVGVVCNRCGGTVVAVMSSAGWYPVADGTERYMGDQDVWSDFTRPATIENLAFDPLPPVSVALTEERSPAPAWMRNDAAANTSSVLRAEASAAKSPTVRRPATWVPWAIFWLLLADLGLIGVWTAGQQFEFADDVMVGLRILLGITFLVLLLWDAVRMKKSTGSPFFLVMAVIALLSEVVIGRGALAAGVISFLVLAAYLWMRQRELQESKAALFWSLPVMVVSIPILFL